MIARYTMQGDSTDSLELPCIQLLMIVALRTDPEPPQPPTQTPPAPVEEPPDKPESEPGSPVHEPDPREPKRWALV